MAGEIIRPKDLTPRPAPVASELMVVDNSVNVGAATIKAIVEVGRPAASQVEAQTGVDASKAMTPLTTKQSIASEVGVTIASKAQGALAATAVQPEALAAVATSGAYDDLSGKPVIPPGLADGDKGDISVSSSGTVWEINKRFDTVASLLADTTMGYAGSGAAVLVGPGDIVEAQGYRYQVAASGVSDNGVVTAGGVKHYILPNPDNTITERQFGAPGDGSKTNPAAGTDVTAALQKWLSHPSNAVRVIVGANRVTSQLALPPGVVVRNGGGGINAGGGLSSGDQVLIRQAARVPLPALAADIFKGGMSIALTNASAVVEGDFLHLVNPTPSSWTSWRPDYSAGEFVHVQRKEGNILYLTSPLYASYTASSITVSKLDPAAGAPVDIGDFWVIAPANRDAILVRNVINPKVRIRAWGSKTALVGVDSCVRIDIDSITDGAYDAAEDNDYGVSISSCQWGMIRGFYTAGRHAIATTTYTGNIPSRALLVMAPSLGNYAHTAFDAGHAGVEDITIMGGTFTSGGIGGKNVKYVGTRFRRGGDGIAAYAGETIEGDFAFHECDFEIWANPNAANLGAIQLGNQTSNVAATCRFFFINCRYRMSATIDYLFRLDIDGVSDANAPELHIVGGHIVGAGLDQLVYLRRYSGSSTIKVIRITGVTGMPTACKLVVNSSVGTLNVTEYILDPQVGSATITPLTSAAAVTAAVTFPREYPVAPKVVVPVSRGRLLGGKLFTLAVTAKTAAGCSVEASAASGTNFDSATAQTVDYIAHW